MAPTTRRAKRAFAEPPTDVLFDVFLLLSAKELCRLRAVCCAWRSLTCDPLFIRAHTARHHRWDKLLVASFLSGPPEERTMLIDLIDLSGKTVKRLASGIGPGQVLCPRLGLGLVLVANKADNTCRVLDPAATDARAPVVPPPRFRLPMLLAPSHRGPGTRRYLREAATSFAFGRVATTGEHKVLRIFHSLKDDDDRSQQLFEVLTLGSGRHRGRARWRDMPSPNMFICPDSSVVVDGVVYFLRNNAVYRNGIMAARPDTAGTVVPPPASDCVASFDLEREEWRKRLQGPITMGYDGDNESDDELVVYDDGDNESDDELVVHDRRWCKFALAELKGSLVLLHYVDMVTDLWLLTDFERGVWMKKCSIRPPGHSVVPASIRRPKPLFVLDGWKLVVVREQVDGEVAIYYPRTGAWTWTITPGPLPHGPVGIYTGSLLGLQDAW